MKKSWMIGGLAAAVVAAALGLATTPAQACEPIHSLLRFGGDDPPPPPPGSTLVVCEDGQVICDDPNDPTTCITCGQLGLDRLCWASECRGFNGDTGQFGQFKKDYPGELEAIIIESWNLVTNEVVTIVDKIANPTCAAQIPAQSANVSCDSLYKVKATHPIGGSNPGPLCTFDNLDDVNTISRTPASQGVIITDVNGQQCEARKKIGDQWWMYYQTCCSPVAEFGNVGDQIATSITLVFDQNGTCLVDSVRPDQSDPETIPQGEANPCL
jgi:hypothetical protein